MFERVKNLRDEAMSVHHGLFYFPKNSADPSFEIPDPLPLPLSSWSGLTRKARRVYITYSRFLEIGPTPGCSLNHSPECVAKFEKAFGKSEGEGSAASAPPPDPETFLSVERFDVPNVVPREDEDDMWNEQRPISWLVLSQLDLIQLKSSLNRALLLTMIL